MVARVGIWVIAVEKSATQANRFAESLTDLSSIGLEKSRKLQRGYIKVVFLEFCTVAKCRRRLVDSGSAVQVASWRVHRLEPIRTGCRDLFLQRRDC